MLPSFVWLYWALHQTPKDGTSILPQNIDRARIRGLEARIGYAPGNWRVQSNLSLIDPRNDSSRHVTNNGNLLARRPQCSMRIDLDHRIGGYTTTDLRASYHFARHWSCALRLANAFNRHYETIRYYNQPGRRYFLTLHYRPKVNLHGW